MKINNTKHILTDLVDPSLDVIICDAVGPFQLKQQAVPPTNKFYDILCRIGLTNKS